MSGLAAKPENVSNQTQTSTMSSLKVFICSGLLIAITVGVVQYLNNIAVCCADSQKELAELKAGLENIKMILERDRQPKEKHGSDSYPVVLEDGARWRAFWWYKKSSGWPRCPNDVLEGEYGSCDSLSSYCFGRLPQQLSETGAEMLAKDSAGNIYRWAFDTTNSTAHAAWEALHDHIQTPAGVILNSHVWNPKVIAGNKPKEPQDSFMYRSEHGVISLLLDDDNCDCLSSLSLGHGLCKDTFYIQFGPENRYGVDLLFDVHCQTPSPDNGLTLYFKDEDNCAGVNCGPGMKCVDGVDTYSCMTA